MTLTLATSTFSILIVIVIIFQACLAIGLPWGKASMGGKFPGKYPTNMRFVAILNMATLLCIAFIMLSRAEVFDLQSSSFIRTFSWGIVVYFALGTIMNVVTPSKIERIWAPVCALLMVSSLIIANS